MYNMISGDESLPEKIWGMENLSITNPDGSLCEVICCVFEMCVVCADQDSSNLG